MRLPLWAWVALTATVIAVTGAAFCIALERPGLQAPLTVAATVLAGCAGLLAAVATALAASAAQRAASASESTARQAGEALARSLRPDFHVDAWLNPWLPDDPHGTSERGGVTRGHCYVSLNATTRVAARDIDVTVRTTEGRPFSHHVARLSFEPEQDSRAQFGIEHRTIRLEGGDGSSSEGLVDITVEFSDDRLLGRWRQTWVRTDDTSRGSRWLSGEAISVPSR